VGERKRHGTESSLGTNRQLTAATYEFAYPAGTSIPYGDSAPRGDLLWAFKIGGTVAEAPTSPPPVIRRPVSGAPVEAAR
jgi:hypothetical protein